MPTHSGAANTRVVFLGAYAHSLLLQQITNLEVVFERPFVHTEGVEHILEAGVDFALHLLVVATHCGEDVLPLTKQRLDAVADKLTRWTKGELF